MKIAAIVITYNDDYKFDEWCKWYEEYKEQIALYIIVDNNSKPEYKEKVSSYFSDAHIIWRKSNGGCTSAYNDGIRFALSHSDITHIALVGNDMRLSENCLVNCSEILDANENLGMISPVILKADSSIVENYGCNISVDLSMVLLDRDRKLSEIGEEFRFCEAVPGGMNVSKRSFYETVGLQDEKLFMYSDEVDMALRAKAKGIRFGSTTVGKAWHQHINPQRVEKRLPYSNYLIARNKTYLAKKHFGTCKQLFIFNVFLKNAIKTMFQSVSKFSFDQLIYPRWSFIGAVNGLIGNMKLNKYSKL